MQNCVVQKVQIVIGAPSGCEVEESAALAFRVTRLLRSWLSDAVQLIWLRPSTKLRIDGRFEVGSSQDRQMRYKQAYFSLDVSFPKRVNHRIHCGVQN